MLARPQTYMNLSGRAALHLTDALHIPLSGWPAKVVTRGYHLMAMPGNRIRTAIDWMLDAAVGRQSVQLGLVRSAAVPLDTASPELSRQPGGDSG